MGVTTMSTIWTKSRAEMRQLRGKGVPFIGLEEPFVGSDGLGIGPSIRLKQPFIRELLKSGGFTLVELIITLVIAAILLTIAAPNMSAFIQRDRLITQANEMVADLSLARSEAIKRGARVGVCKTGNPAADPPVCNTTGGDPWTSGRVIWVDANNDGVVDAGEAVLRRTQALDGNGNRLFGQTGAENLIAFSALGMALAGGNGQLVFCDKRGPSKGVAIGIGVTGRTTIGPHGKTWDGGADLTAADCP